MSLLDQLTLADELLNHGDTMLEPHDLPGRYGRVIADLERLLGATGTLAVVAGGWAVWRHGYVGRVTQDVDIVIPDASQVDLLRAAPMCGFRVLPVGKGSWPKLFHRATEIDVDLMPELAFPGTQACRAPVPIRHPSVYGAQPGKLKYISLDNLFELKLGAHRIKDLADLVELIKVNPNELDRIEATLDSIHPAYSKELQQLIQQAEEEGR